MVPTLSELALRGVVVKGYHCILLESQHLMEFYRALAYDGDQALLHCW